MSTANEAAEVIDEASKALAKNPNSKWQVRLVAMLLVVAVYGTNLMHGIDARMDLNEQAQIHVQEMTNRELGGLSESFDVLAGEIKDGLENGKHEREAVESRVFALEASVQTLTSRVDHLEN